VYKSFSPLMHGAPRALMLVNGRNLFLAFLVFEAARLLFRAQPTTDWAPVVPQGVGFAAGPARPGSFPRAAGER
jgi:hypothetical protein